MIRMFLFGCAVVFFSVFQSSFTFGAVSGPDRIETGKLTTFVSDTAGDWVVYPMSKATFAKDSDKKKLYLVANDEGEFSVVHFSVENGEAVISAFQFTALNKKEPKPEPEPEPVIKYELTEKERDAVVTTIQDTIKKIESGEIRSTAGARSVFKQEISRRGTVCNGNYCSISSGIKNNIDEWSGKIDYSDLDSMKDSLEELLEEVR